MGAVPQVRDRVHDTSEHKDPVSGVQATRDRAAGREDHDGRPKRRFVQLRDELGVLGRDCDIGRVGDLALVEGSRLSDVSSAIYLVLMGMRQRDARTFLAGFVLAVVLAGGSLLGWELSRPAGPSRVSIPVATCSSRYGISPTPLSGPAKVTVEMPSVLQGKLSFYVDTDWSLTPFLAPEGWSCSTSEGVDGTYEMAAYPRGTPDTLNSTGPAHGHVETVISDGSPICAGCADDIACSVFTEAYLSNPASHCPLSSPRLESVSYLDGSSNSNTGTAQIYDPPGVYGSLPQSGGADPANGVITYSKTQITSADVLSCVLPASDASWCAEIAHVYLHPPKAIQSR